MDSITAYFSDTLTLADRLGPSDIAVFLFNLTLILFSRRILRYVYHAPEYSMGFRIHLTVFRLLNLLVIVSFAYYHAFSPEQLKGWGLKLVLILLTIYISYIVLHLMQHFVRQHYGEKKTVGDERQVLDTYASRLTNIIVSILVFCIALIAIIKILGFSSLLEAGGVLGFIGVLLVVTNGFWAPDIFSGLVILNSGMAEAGDVIELDGNERTLGQVFKIKLFHTVIRNLVNNHRIMVRNSVLRNQIIHNLSRFASAKGLRDNMRFKIGYADEASRVRAMFEDAYQALSKCTDIKIEFQYPLEIGVYETGDFAVEWIVYYYTKDVRNLIRIRQGFRETILLKSREHGISLATPMQHQLENAPPESSL